MLRLERDAWLMVKSLKQAINEYAPPLNMPPPQLLPQPTVVASFGKHA